MRIVFQIVVILCVLIGFGAAKLSYEDQLNKDMVENQLIQPSLKQGTNLQLGQTGAAVALGGLRSLVAAMWNLRAFIHFEKLDWIKLEESYGVITTLQPQTTHYWDTGAWHLHTNASVHYNEDRNLSPLRRKALRKLYIDKGSALLEEGVRQNPENWKLHISLARLWSDRFKLPDLQRAVTHYDNSLATQTMPGYKRKQYKRFRFYSLARIPARKKEALNDGTELFLSTSDNHLPNLVCCLFALQNAAELPEKIPIPDKDLFPDDKTQYTWLTNYWKNRHISYPMDGVLDKRRELAIKLGIPTPDQ